MPPSHGLSPRSIQPLAPPLPALDLQNNDFLFNFPQQQQNNNDENDDAALLEQAGLPAAFQAIVDAPNIDAQLAMLGQALLNFEQNIVQHAQDLGQPVALLREKIEEMRQEVDDIKWSLAVMRMQLRTLVFSGLFCCSTMIVACGVRIYRSLRPSFNDLSYELLPPMRQILPAIKFLTPSVACLSVASYLYRYPAARFRIYQHHRLEQKKYIKVLKMVNLNSLINIAWNVGMMFVKPLQQSWISLVQIGLATATIKFAVNAASINISVNFDVALE